MSKRTKSDAEQSIANTVDVPRETTDPLSEYRDAIASVALAGEELTRLRSLEISLQRDADGSRSIRVSKSAGHVRCTASDGL
jgi:hypothetical protein